MKSVGVSTEVHVGIVGHTVVGKPWKFATEGCKFAMSHGNSSILGRGAASSADSFHKLCLRMGCHSPSSPAAVRCLSPDIASSTNLKRGHHLKSNFFPRIQWEELQYFSGNSGSSLRKGRRGNWGGYPSAEVRLARSRHAVEGEGYPAAVEEVHKNQSEGLYRPFADFAVGELTKRFDVSPLLLKGELRNMVARDGLTSIQNKAFESSKIRCFRSTCINGGSSLQVLNVAGLARPEYDIPIFCADFFSTADRNIIVLDLNPLYSTSTNKYYKEKYYDNLLPLSKKHMEVLTWGGKVTAESVQFFSPLVLWTKAKDQNLQQTLYPAFQDYLLAWFSILDAAQPTVNSEAIAKNQEAQHRYLTWRATKDPGRPLLTRLYGEELSEKYIEEYLFQGLKTLGTKTFLDYFPEYRAEDNTVRQQRSMVGKSFFTRPWDEHGNFHID
ncbi:hypothetical protein R1flu_008979 [Riccia fluitans]|uniref:Uncharacterized protein n=1 Tax=Riccia fluitans TaxID=41844 RepID=A0ABD1Z3S5_9MARC